MKKMSHLLLYIGMLFISYGVIHYFQWDNFTEKHFSSNAISSIGFGILYIVLSLSFIPRAVLSLAAGMIFGLFPGFLIIWLASTLSAILAYSVARYAALDWVEKRIKGQLANIRLGIQEKGWQFVALARLVPILPFTPLNYALGLTAINFFQYSLVTMVGVIPISIYYAYLGETVKYLADYL